MSTTHVSTIAIHGAPRSGTSWLGQLFNSHENVAYRYQPFFSYAFRGAINHESNAADIRRVLEQLLATRDDFVLQTGDARLSQAPLEFDKADATHLVYKEVRFHDLLPIMLELTPTLRAIGIVRDPRSVLASWFSAPREFKRDWNPLEEWRLAPRKNANLPENWYGYERWKELATLFIALQRRYQDRFLLIRYEDLVAQPNKLLSQLFSFAGLDPSDQSARFVTTSTSRDDGDPYGVFRRHGSIGTGELPKGIAEAVERDLAHSELSNFLRGQESP